MYMYQLCFFDFQRRNTPQERTLLACHDKLIDTLSTHPVKYAYDLLAAGFISSRDHSEMMKSSLTPTEKATMLMRAVREEVKVNPSAIHDFLQILLKEESNRDIVKAVVQRLESEGQYMCHSDTYYHIMYVCVVKAHTLTCISPQEDNLHLTAKCT